MATLHRRSSRSRSSVCLLLRTLFLLVALPGLLLAACAADQPATTPIAKLLPADALFVLSGDTAGFAQNLDKLQAIPKLQDALGAADKALGFSLEKDVASWTGQLGYAFLDVNANDPRMVVLVEIRDQAAFAQALPLLQPNMEKLSELKWTTDTYKGVDVHYGLTDPAHPSAAWGQVGGWLVVGIGEGALQKTIDTWKGKTPALADNAAWLAALKGLPVKRSCLFSLNGDALAKIIDDHARNFNGITPAPLRGVFVVGSTSETDTAEQIDVIKTFASPDQQRQILAFKKSLTPIDRKALTQLPANTFAELLISNPGALVAFVKQTLLGFMAGADGKQMIETKFAQIQPVLQLLNTVSGAFAIAGSWSKETGFGISAVGETADAATAAKLFTLFTTYVRANQQQEVDVQDGVASLPAETPANPMLPLEWSWAVKNAWIKLGTTPLLINTNGLADAKLPPQALGADCVFLADLGFLTALLDQFEAQGGKNEVINGIRMLAFDKLKIIGYSRIADDGSSAHAVLELHNANGAPMAAIGAAAVVAAVLFPVFAKAREKARETQSLSKLRQLAIAAMEYAQDNDLTLPPLKTADDIKRVLKVPDAICIQISSQLPYLPNASLAGKALGDIPAQNQTDIVIFYEQTPTEDGHRCAAFLDGHVAMLSADDWAKAKAKSGIK